MKKFALSLVAIATIATLTACGGGSATPTPATVSNAPSGAFAMKAQSVSHYSDASGDHRVVHILVGEGAKSAVMTVTETVSPTNPNLDHVEARTAQGVMTADFTVNNNGTDVAITLNGKPYYHTTMTQHVTQIADGQIDAALAQVTKNHVKEGQKTAEGLPLALCWGVCVGGIEIEGPFVLACLAACQAMSLN